MAQRPLIGTSPNQVSTNGMLGDLAFQDSNGAYIETIRGAVNLDKLDKEITDTVVDVFVYDTRKDSDGGAWRKRTQHTSWYNETLNTATRGSRREFPAVAVIVVSTNTVKIYDGDDPDLPMWMVFNGGSYQNMIRSNANSIHALNGTVAVGLLADQGLVRIEFIADTSKLTTSYANAQRYYKGNILQRNTTIDYDYGYPALWGSIVNGFINDVAMTVLPNAPIDDATGLPIPTIAVATNGGVSVIKDDGNVYDLNVVNRPYSSVYFSPDNLVWAVENPGGVNYDLLRYFEIPSADITVASSYGPSSNPALFPTNTKGNIFDSFAYGSPVGLTKIDHADGSAAAANGLVAYATTSYNTGWMHGDIKGAFLSDTTVESLTNNTGNVVTNSTFSSDSDWTKESGWSITGGIARWTSGIANEGKLYQTISLVAGKNYVATVDLTDATVAGDVWFEVRSSTVSGSVLLQKNIGAGAATGTYTYNFTPTTGTNVVIIHSYGGAGSAGDNSEYDNLKIYPAEEDRSVNNNGLQVFGTINKSAVATGAELVAYSGFSASNYLLQPYNSDLDFSGSFYIMCWVKTTDFSTDNQYIIWKSTHFSNTTPKLEIFITSGYYGIYIHDGSSGGSVTTSGLSSPTWGSGVWSQLVFVRSGSTGYIYENGVLKNSGSLPSGTISTGDLHIGRRSSNSDYYYRGSVSLVRTGVSAPSAEQIKKMYEDEKVLFQENAACTLYGSSDAVTALAYDDSTNLLYAGTSSGRSDFQGLRRINNTTTAVTTAISASNGLVAEQ